jgi:hypothetical protein
MQKKDTGTKKYPEMNDEEKVEMWAEIADYFTLPKDERPMKQQDLYQSYGIPERTFYWKLQEEEFSRLIVKKTLVKARRFIPEIVKALQKNVDQGSK